MNYCGTQEGPSHNTNPEMVCSGEFGFSFAFSHLRTLTAYPRNPKQKVKVTKPSLQQLRNPERKQACARLSFLCTFKNVFSCDVIRYQHHGTVLMLPWVFIASKQKLSQAALISTYLGMYAY